MASAESKPEYIARAKALLRADLRAKSWEEKVRAIERMNAMQRKWSLALDKDAKTTR